jgi:hypothetical protein
MLFDRLKVPETIRATKIEFQYLGPQAHFAPTSVTPLQKAMYGKTNSAVITLIAGVTLIVARRLESVADTRLLHQLVEVLLCFEAAPGYYSSYYTENPRPKRNDAEEVISGLFMEAGAVLVAKRGKHSNFPPMQALKNSVALAELVLGKTHRPYLREFLTSSIDALARVAANPNQVFTKKSDYETQAEWEAVVRMNFGTPVPIEALDASRNLDREALAPLFNDFLKSVDWRANPYLTPLDRLRSEGAVTNPYLADH